jgi:hypothetical protein
MDGGREYALSYIDLPIPAGEPKATIQKRLDGARDGMVRNLRGTLVSSSRITLQKKYPGRQVQATLPTAQQFLHGRVYLVGTRLYLILVSGPKEWATSAEATRFLDSLVVTP